MLVHQVARAAELGRGGPRNLPPLVPGRFNCHQCTYRSPLSFFLEFFFLLFLFLLPALAFLTLGAVQVYIGVASVLAGTILALTAFMARVFHKSRTHKMVLASSYNFCMALLAFIVVGAAAAIAFGNALLLCFLFGCAAL